MNGLLVTWMLRGLAASRTGMVRMSTPRRSWRRSCRREGLAEEELPVVDGVGPLGAVSPGRGAFGANGEHVLLDGHADGVRGDAGQVKENSEVVALPVGGHRHHRGPGRGSEDLLDEPVELAERVGAHDQSHDRDTRLSWRLA